MTTKMSEHIEKAEALKALDDLLRDLDNWDCGKPDVYVDGVIRGAELAREKIESVSAADVVPVKRGEWVYGEFDIPHCSECGKEVMPNKITPFCPNCGAGMEIDE